MKKIFLAVFAIAILSCVQALAQGTGGSDFQFNELDFDRQGTGGYPEASPYSESGSDESGSYPATKFLDPKGSQSPAGGGGEDLTNLFSDLPSSQDPPIDAAPEGNLHNLPGEPSPVTEPAKPGEAKIELAQTPPPQPPKASEQAPPRARTASKTSRTKPSNGTINNRWYWASEAWRDHPPAERCSSYVQNRELYHVRCIEAVARYNDNSNINSRARQSIPASYAPSAGDNYLSPGLKDIRQFP
jgi:hypothetical protein